MSPPTTQQIRAPLAKLYERRTLEIHINA